MLEQYKSFCVSHLSICCFYKTLCHSECHFFVRVVCTCIKNVNRSPIFECKSEHHFVFFTSTICRKIAYKRLWDQKFKYTGHYGMEGVYHNDHWVLHSEIEGLLQYQGKNYIYKEGFVSLKRNHWLQRWGSYLEWIGR